MDSTIGYRLTSYGCKVNTYDSGLLQNRLSQSGFVSRDNGQVPVHILNTCAVTAEATKEALRKIRKIKRENPRSLVVITGCAAQVDTDKFSEETGADLVVANSHKGDLEKLIRERLQNKQQNRVFKNNIFKKTDLEPGGGVEKGHTRSFLKIQDGCNSFCTFCIIPFARGKSRSVPIAELVRRARELSAQGYRELVLTGVHIGDYQDGERKLEDLVEALLSQTSVPRLRLSSLEPVELSDRLLGLFTEPRLCSHFHMSIQSANTRVLGLMKRKYGQREVVDSLCRIREALPEAFIGMDVIAGFPGESREEFNDTCKALESAPWSRIHVFPYSPRGGTYAMKLPGHWPRMEITERAAKLREISQERYAVEAAKQVGKVYPTMVLNKKSSLDHHGVTRNYWPMEFYSTKVKPGEEVWVEVTGYDRANWQKGYGSLVGRRLSKT